MIASAKVASTSPPGTGIAVVGGGLAGSLVALMLASRGHTVDVFERNADPRQSEAGGGRSINLGLSKRGIQALTQAGLLDEVMEMTVVMRGRVIHLLDGSTRFQPYGKNRGEVLHSVDRNELNRLLLDRAEAHPNVRLHFEHSLTTIDKEQRVLGFRAAKGELAVQPEWVIGADGAFSRVREQMQRGERADYHREYLEWGYKELTLAAGPDGESLIDLTALHVWPRKHCLFVSHPNRDGSHTLTLFLPFEGEDSFATTRKAEDVRQLFVKYFPDLLPLLPGLLPEWVKHPVGSLVTTRTAPWRLDDWVVLVGDACHAVYPFYGQGMNSAFEDCSALLQALDSIPRDRRAAFGAYEASRRPHTDILAELSKTNFIELKQKVQSFWFLARKRLDVFLNRIMPRIWMPLYTMIAHTTMPYGDALTRSRAQDRILGWVLAGMICFVCAALAATFW